MGERWEVRRAGPADAAHRVLMIPGALCTTEFYADVMAEPAVAGLGMVAAALPGFGGTEAPEDVSMEHYARLMADFAAEAGCDVVVGHSLGANVALEMAALGLFRGPLVLLSPAFSRGDEMKSLAVLNSVGRVPGLGAAVWAGMLGLLPRAMRRELPPRRAEALAAAMSGNDPATCRRIVRRYYAYLDRYPDLVRRLGEAGVPAWVVRGDHDEIGLTDDERRGLEACPHLRLVSVPDAGHAVLVDQPAAVAEVVAEAVTAEVR
ncbi:alpha/beta hydrolase [Streptomyces sp. NPDC002588]|uniref:alpha/beta fold hydrolase n=1 Tax=Streptomyces sp. NPDC002588 TaxID=3154419 RepID=UPI00331BB261